MGREMFLQIAPPNTRFLEPTAVHIPNGMSIGSAHGCDQQTQRPTHRPHCISNNRLAMYAALRLNNSNTVFVKRV